MILDLSDPTLPVEVGRLNGDGWYIQNVAVHDGLAVLADFGAHLRVVDVFSEIRRVLRPGGAFYHCDMLKPANPVVASLYGLYLNIESLDDAFVDHRSPVGGSLYEGEYGCDLYPDDVAGFDRGVLPIGDWSTSMTLSMSSSPSIPSWSSATTLLR